MNKAKVNHILDSIYVGIRYAQMQAALSLGLAHQKKELTSEEQSALLNELGAISKFVESRCKEHNLNFKDIRKSATWAAKQIPTFPLTAFFDVEDTLTEFEDLKRIEANEKSRE